jgi:putative transposase
MHYATSRISWDTSVKHFIKLGLYDTLPENLKTKISKTNKHRWKNELDTKYQGFEVSNYIKSELELLKELGASTKTKKVIKAVIKLSKIVRKIIEPIKGFKKQIADQKEKIETTIEKFKNIIPVNEAIKIFNISRATYQNYKILVINKCDSSLFEWCVKNTPINYYEPKYLK